jgi:hypothetical protein
METQVSTFYVRDEFFFYQDLEILFSANLTMLHTIQQMKLAFSSSFPLPPEEMKQKRNQVAMKMKQGIPSFKLEEFIIKNKEIQQASKHGMIHLALVSDACILEIDSLL